MAFLSLPQLKIEFNPMGVSREALDAVELLVLGGRAPDPAWLSRAAEGRIVWAVDRGAEACKAAEVKPDHALGDFDSIGQDAKDWLKRLGIEPELYPADKDYTDFQLCLNRARGNVAVTGCWGGRFDHAFSNVFSALWGSEWGADVRAFADESEILIPLRGKAEAELDFRVDPAVLSLLPLSSGCGGVSLRGTKWPLEEVQILQRHPYAVSNVPIGRNVSVKIDSGTVGVYCFFESARTADLPGL